MQPSIFISHGSPMIAVEDHPARRFLIDLGKRLEKPKAILIVSAHYDTLHPTLAAVDRPETIHDFGGFPRDLYEIQYPAPGAPETANQIMNSLRAAGFSAETQDRGLDHGAWIPLLLMFPEADVPVIELSVMTQRGPNYHFKLGQALQELRRENILVIGSGGATHNLHEFFRRVSGEPNTEPTWLTPFEDWLIDRIEAGATEDLLEYRERAPYAVQAHPTEEHFLPLFVAMGAGDSPVGRRIHSSRDLVLTMDAYEFTKD